MKYHYYRALELIEVYNNRYNTQFEISELYSLFPNQNEYGFTESWPFLNEGGVYLILNKNQEVIYVGKADVFGHRLYYHFRADREGNCIIVETGWKDHPHYIINIKVPASRLYENLSLEGYLIQELDPEENTIGRSRK